MPDATSFGGNLFGGVPLGSVFAATKGNKENDIFLEDLIRKVLFV